MSINVTHTFVSAKPEQSDPTIIGPNEWNALHTVVSTLPVYPVSDYNFAPQTPGNTLAVGTNAFVLNPVPPGIAVGGNLYISGGTGTAEAVPINGFSQASGQVIVSCAYAHSGAWTISSASGGLQEAINAIQFTGIIFVNANPNSPILVHAQIVIPNCGWSIYFKGNGKYLNCVLRAPDYLTGNLFYIYNVGTAVIMEDFAIVNNSGTSVISGAAIYAQNTQNLTQVPGSIVLRNMCISGGSYCTRFIGVPFELYSISFFNFDTSYKPIAVVSAESPYTPSVVAPASNCLMSDCFMFVSTNNANCVTYGLYCNGVDGFVIDNCTIQGDTAVYITATNGTYTDLIQMNQIMIDTCITDGVTFAGDGHSTVGAITFTDSHVTGAKSGSGIEIGSTSPAGQNIYGIRIHNVDISLNYYDGIVIGEANQVTITGCHITANNTSNTPSRGGIKFQYNYTMSDIIITGNIIKNTVGYSTGNQSYGIIDNGSVGATNIIIMNNDLTGNVTAGMHGSFNGVTANNPGWNPVGPTIVTPGASPWTYTNGPTPATLYLFGGVITNVQLVVGPANIGNSSPFQVQLGPQEGVIITYTTVPNAMIDVK